MNFLNPNSVHVNLKGSHDKLMRDAVDHLRKNGWLTISCYHDGSIRMTGERKIHYLHESLDAVCNSVKVYAKKAGLKFETTCQTRILEIGILRMKKMIPEGYTFHVNGFIKAIIATVPA